MAFDFINRAIDKMVGIGVGKAKNAISDIANDTTTAVKNVGSSIVDTAKEANYQFGKSISENLVEPIKANLSDKGVDLTKPAEGTTFQQAVEYAKRVPIAGTAIFDQFAIKNPTKVLGAAVDLYSDYQDDNQLNNSSKVGAKTGDVIQTFGENVGFQKPVTSAGDVFNAGKALINSETKAQVIDNGLKVGNSLFQTVMNASRVANVVGGAFQTGMKETGSDVAVEKVTKQGANILSDSLQSVGVEKNDADSLGRTLIDTIITVVSLGGYAKGSSKVGGYKKVASNMAQEDLKAALKTKTIPKSDATSFLLSRTKEIESNLRPVDVMKYNAGKILTDVKYQSAVPIITAIIDGVQNGFDTQKLEDAGKATTATAGSTIIGGAIPPVKPTGKKSKTSTVDEAQTKIAIDETINTQVKEATPVTDTYNLNNKKSAYNFITNQKRFDEKGIVYKASTSDGKEVYGNLDIHNKKMVLRIPNSNQVYSVMSISKIDTTPIKVSDIPVQKEVIQTPETSKVEPTPKVEVPIIKATPSMAFGKPSVQGNSKAVYTSDDPNITQIVRSAIISNKGTAKTAPEHTNALTEAGFSPEEVGLIRDFAVRVADKNGYINSEGMKNFLTSLKNRQPEATTATPEKATPTPEAKAELPASPEPTPTPDLNQTLISLVETYKGDGKTKGKVGSIQVDFENELNKALYSVRESKNKLKPKDESTLQELARLSGLDEAQIRKLGEDVATKIKDKIYREKAVTPEGVKLDDTNVPKEDDILGLNDTPAPEVVSPLTQRYQELIANNAKEGDELSRAKGIFDFTPTGKIGNFFQKTFDKLWSNIDRIASTKTFLNNFRVGGGKELAGNYVESKQARDNSQFNTANIDEFDIPGMVKRASSAPKRELKESDLVGATTPEGLVLDDTLAQKAYDTYRLDGDKVVERAVPLIAKGVSSKDIKQFIQNTYIYDIFKNNPEKLNEFFTPEQIAVFRKDDASSASIQSNIVKSSQDIGFFPKEIDPENGYLRKVTTARAAKEAGKMKGADDGKIEVTLSDGTVIRADTMEEALRLSLLKRDSENFNPENMSSLTKKQAGPEYDPFRYHGYGASLLSLNDAMSKLYADKNAIKFIDGLIEKGDPNYTGAMKTKAYNLMAKDILGIRGTAKSEGLAETHLGTAANLGTKGAMLVNVGNATTNIVPSYLRTLMRSSMDLLTTAAARGIKEGWEGVKGAFKDAKLSQITKSMGDERVDARLRGLGLVNEYNIDNGSPYGKLEGQLMYMSNGTWAEIPGSKLAATLSMANSLNRAGRLKGAKDANDVIDRWEAWQKEGGQDFYEARGALDDQLRSLGKTGSTDKVNIPYVPASVNDILGKLKTWAVVQAMAQKEGINTVARSAIEKVFQKDRSYSNRQVEESIKDLGARYATYLATSAALGTIMQATGIFDENDDPEYKKLIIDEATRKIAPDPTVPYLWTLEQAVISDSAATSTILNGGKAAFQLLAAIKNQIEGDKKESDVYLRDALANLGKIGTVRNVSDIVGTFNKGDSLQDIVAKGADTFSKEEAIRTGVSSGKNWNSSLDRGLKLFGINGEQARLDALYRMKNNLAAPDWVKSVPFGGLMYQAVEREMRPVIDYIDDTKSSGGGGDLMENGIRAGYAYDVVKDLHNSKDSAEFFQKNGLEGKDEMVQELMKNLITSNISQNKNVDERYEQLVQGISSQTFLQDMEKLRGLDPYLYNNVVATLGELKEIKDQAGSLSPEVLNRRVIDRIKNKTNSISQEDYAIAQANDDYALTTSFTNAIGKDIAKVNKDLDDSKPQEAKEKMDNLEKLSAVMNSPSIYQYKIPFANLIANNATDIKKAFTILGADPNSYPFLKNAMLFGAKVVRGAMEPKQPEVVTPPAPSPLSGTTLRSMVRKPVIIDKPATVSNITIDKPLKVGQLKIDPLLVKLPTSQQGASLSNQTLSSMVKRKTPKL